jgi:hypothetical protein
MASSARVSREMGSLRWLLLDPPPPDAVLALAFPFPFALPFPFPFRRPSSSHSSSSSDASPNSKPSSTAFRISLIAWTFSAEGVGLAKGRVKVLMR